MWNVEKQHTAQWLRLAGLLGAYCLTGLAVLMGLAACTSDADSEPEPQRQTLEAVGYASTFQEIKPASQARSPQAATRAGFPPAGYSNYADLYGATGLFKDQFSNVEATICAFFTRGENSFIDGTDASTPSHFTHNKVENKWVVSPALSLSGAYHIYGYVPNEAVTSATLSGSDYMSGAVLTLNDIQSVTPYDLCVIVGAKEEEDIVSGDFTFRSNLNKLYLLFDHLFTALKFSFKVDATYNALRTIKITKLELLAFADGSGTRLKSKYNATIRLSKNSTGASPIESLVFTPDAASAPMEYQTLYSGNEVELKTDVETSFMGCFVPGNHTYFKLRTTYNVYDSKGNLIRERCEAENAINIRTIFKITDTELLRGNMYSLIITVDPTYLYVLSDPDQDNPFIIKQ